jgi:hypothetical protein
MARAEAFAETGPGEDVYRKQKAPMSNRNPATKFKKGQNLPLAASRASRIT